MEGGADWKLGWLSPAWGPGRQSQRGGWRVTSPSLSWRECLFETQSDLCFRKHSRSAVRIASNLVCPGWHQYSGWILQSAFVCVLMCWGGQGDPTELSNSWSRFSFFSSDPHNSPRKEAKQLLPALSYRWGKPKGRSRASCLGWTGHEAGLSFQHFTPHWVGCVCCDHVCSKSLLLQSKLKYIENKRHSRHLVNTCKFFLLQTTKFNNKFWWQILTNVVFHSKHL